MFDGVAIFLSSFGIFIVYNLFGMYVKKSKLKNYLKPVASAFIAGYLFKMGCSMWMQDTLGLDAYIAMMTEHWTEMPPVMGASIAAFCIYWLYSLVRKMKGLFDVNGKCAKEYDL